MTLTALASPVFARWRQTIPNAPEPRRSSVSHTLCPSTRCCCRRRRCSTCVAQIYSRSQTSTHSCSWVLRCVKPSGKARQGWLTDRVAAPEYFVLETAWCKFLRQDRAKRAPRLGIRAEVGCAKRQLVIRRWWDRYGEVVEGGERERPETVTHFGPEWDGEFAIGRLPGTMQIIVDGGAGFDAGWVLVPDGRVGVVALDTICNQTRSFTVGHDIGRPRRRR